ncbi:MAG: hypothetical protein IPN80_08115 [Flavobacterium sp.]|nr:hypothetical protein [Flavobacterium sp.]
MKTTITFLFAAFMIMTSSIAKNSINTSGNTMANKSIIAEVEQGDSFESNSVTIENSRMAPIEDQTIVNPEAILNLKYQRDIMELIGQDKKIIESPSENTTLFVISEQSIEDIISIDNQVTEHEVYTTVRPLFLEKTVEDLIAEDNLIIENEFKSIAQPLDFEVINKVQTILKKDKLLF